MKSTSKFPGSFLLFKKLLRLADDILEGQCLLGLLTAETDSTLSMVMAVMVKKGTSHMVMEDPLWNFQVAVESKKTIKKPILKGLNCPFYL